MNTEIMKTIDEINLMFDVFCEKITSEHHKGRDGVWSISFDRWTNNFIVSHNGYWLDDIWIETPNLLKALMDFRDVIKFRTQKEIAKYDFGQHCAKEFLDD